MDWNHIRSIKFTKDRPPGWPQGVYGITIEGLSLLGVHEQSNRLYWDGREIEFRRIELGLYERVLATLGAVGAFGLFAVEVGKAAGWWH
jgi:hypothetical protein